MAGNSLQIEFDDEAAQRAVDHWQRIVGSGARDAVDQISTLAESTMKAEAPEGVGIPDVNMRTTIKSETTSRDPYRKVIMPHKRTERGWLLHRAIVGNPSVPTYSDEKPPVEPLMEWAGAKLGDPSAAWAIRESIYQDGHDSFPNPFIDRSFREWRSQVDRIAGDAVEQAFRTGGGL